MADAVPEHAHQVFVGAVADAGSGVGGEVGGADDADGQVPFVAADQRQLLALLHSFLHLGRHVAGGAMGGAHHQVAPRGNHGRVLAGVEGDFLMNLHRVLLPIGRLHVDQENGHQANQHRQHD